LHLGHNLLHLSRVGHEVFLLLPIQNLLHNAAVLVQCLVQSGKGFVALFGAVRHRLAEGDKGRILGVVEVVLQGPGFVILVGSAVEVHLNISDLC
jgi:hypothetical protein